MRPSSVVLLLLLSFFLQEAQGIRLEKGFMQVGAQKVVQEEKSSSGEKFKKGGVIGEAILCEGGHCSGMNRKLITVTTSTSSTTITTSKNEKKGGNEGDPIPKGRSSTNGEMGQEHENFSVKASPNSGHEQVTRDHYEEIMDLTEMDYSPARRKPPIHN